MLVWCDGQTGQCPSTWAVRSSTYTGSHYRESSATSLSGRVCESAGAGERGGGGGRREEGGRYCCVILGVCDYIWSLKSVMFGGVQCSGSWM